MTLAATAVALVVLSAATALAMRAVGDADPRLETVSPVRTAVHGLALAGPWLAYFQGLVGPVGPVAGPVVALAGSWGLYVLATWLVGVDGDCRPPAAAEG